MRKIYRNLFIFSHFCVDLVNSDEKFRSVEKVLISVCGCVIYLPIWAIYCFCLCRLTIRLYKAIIIP